MKVEKPILDKRLQKNTRKETGHCNTEFLIPCVNLCILCVRVGGGGGGGGVLVFLHISLHVMETVMP